MIETGPSCGLAARSVWVSGVEPSYGFRGMGEVRDRFLSGIDVPNEQNHGLRANKVDGPKPHGGFGARKMKVACRGRMARRFAHAV